MSLDVFRSDLFGFVLRGHRVAGFRVTLTGIYRGSIRELRNIA